MNKNQTKSNFLSTQSQFSLQGIRLLFINVCACVEAICQWIQWILSGVLVAIWAAVQPRPPDVDQLVILNSYALTLNGRTPATKATTKGPSLTALPLPSASTVTSWHHLGKSLQRCRAMTRQNDSLGRGRGGKKKKLWRCDCCCYNCKWLWAGDGGEVSNSTPACKS